MGRRRLAVMGLREVPAAWDGGRVPVAGSTRAAKPAPAGTTETALQPLETSLGKAPKNVGPGAILHWVRRAA